MNNPNNYRNNNNRNQAPRRNHRSENAPRRPQNDYVDDYDEVQEPERFRAPAARRNASPESTPRGPRNNAQRTAQRYDNRQDQRNDERYDDRYNNQDDDYAENNYPRNSRQAGYRDVPAPSAKKPLLLGLAGLGLVAVAAGVFALTRGNGKVQIVSVTPNYITSQQAYQDCHKVGTTNYVKNHKSGTEGALIGGATGAVAGGIIGNQIHGGGGGTAVGAVAGGVGGALIGDSVEKSHQPDYIAKHGSTIQCQTAYKPVQTQVGYSVQYLYKDAMANIVLQSAPAIGSKIPLEQLQAMEVPPQQLSAPAATNH